MRDYAGRVVSTVVSREPEWSEQDQALILALAEYRANLCPSCGGDLHETTDVGNDDGYRITPPIRCHRCTALSRAAKRYKDEPEPHALMHIVEPRRRR